MIDRGRHPVLGVQVHAVDYEAAVARIIDAANARQPLGVAALAVHGVMNGVDDAEQRPRLHALELVVPDGQPVRWALTRLRGARLEDRVYGPTLTLRVCGVAAREHLPIYLYGSTDATVAALVASLRNRFPGLEVAGFQPSRFRQLSPQEHAAVDADIRDSGARITFVGLGCPRQETWAYEHRLALSMPVLAVGAAFDFHAGTLAQAPAWVQRHGLEWLFRLLREPRRLWRRYVLLNPRYIALIALQALRLRRFDDRGTAPAAEARFG
ncbi:WecB/TagA/CpsF family glycosyltransferase [soil metagenome]